jgi:amino acid adenylation domain-containing protein
VNLGDFSLVEDEHHDDLLTLTNKFNQTKTTYPRDATVPEIFALRAREAPEAMAAAHGNASVTYGELDLASNRFARFLLDHGLEPEGCVGVMLDRSLDIVTVLLGILKAGGAYLPINRATPNERLKYMLDDADARILISDTQQIEDLAVLNEACPNLGTILCLDVDEVDNDISEDSGTDKEDWIYRDFMQGDTTSGQTMVGRSAWAGTSEAPVTKIGGPNTLAYIVYTSGTSGRPKGVMVEHRAILRLVLNTNYIDLGDSDRILQTGSLAFDASTFEIWGALLNGGCVCFPDQHDDILNTARLRQLVTGHGITTLFLTTSLFNLLVDSDVTVFEGLKNLLTGGERVSVPHINKAHQAVPSMTLSHVYGPTENTTFTTSYNVQGIYERDIPIGGPIANSTVYVLDDGVELLPVGAAGELCTGGDGLARGYLNDPELTARKFVQHPFEPEERLYRTGDLARWRQDGALEYLGRIDDQVKVRGFRIEPAEIESCLLQFEPVRQAAVLAVETNMHGRELVAYVVGGPALELDAVRTHLKRLLPDYMVPAHIVGIEAMPLNPNGKVDRNALPDPADVQSGRLRFQEPCTETEMELAQIWQEILGVESVGITDDFFDLGGHSLLVVGMVSKIHERLGVELQFGEVFETPTIRDLADSLVNQARFGNRAIDETMFLLNGCEEGSPIFAFPPLTGDALGYTQIAELLKPYAFYGFNFIESDTRIEDYADLISSIDASGPYVLFGYSGGGNIAFRVAQELEARKLCVSDILMVDSARHTGGVSFPEEEKRQIIKDVRANFASTVLKDKYTRRIESYYAYMSDVLDSHMVDARIHVLLSESGLVTHVDDSGREVVSTQSWAESTQRTFTTYQGVGAHNDMMYMPSLEQNVAILRKIIPDDFTERVHSGDDQDVVS